MAEPEQPKKEGPGKWRQRIKNILTTGLKKIGVEMAAKEITGQELQYELYEGQDPLEVQPVKRLKERNLLDIMESRSNAVSTVEANWDFFNEKREEIEDVYTNSMIYIDSTTSKWEYGLYQVGSEGGKDEMVDIVIKGKPHKYPLPPKVKVRYPIAGIKKDWVVTISPFGYNARGNYTKKYVDLIKQICNDLQENALKNAKSEDERTVIKQRIDYIKGVYTAMISDILTSYCGSEKGGGPSLLNVYPQIERGYYGFVKAAVGKSLEIEGFYPKLYQRRFREQDVMYHHTYKIIQLIVYGTRDESAVVKGILVDKNDETDYRKIYGQSIVIHKWGTEENELGPGLDEYGYPLEVNEDGVVMIDLYSKFTNPRKVPTMFIRNLDLLETVNYINPFHDTYRDDLRDGRYHPYCTTIMDYVQANNKSIWNLWGIRNEDEIQEQSKFDIKLNTPSGEGETEKVIVRPTDKNPAFNLRFLGKEEKGAPHWRHAGRKYYYDVPDGTMKWENKEQHISSRGVSMYIIEKITREMRKFDQTITVLNELGQKGGFDYGTRPWDLWGKVMIQKVYDWRNIMDIVNKPLQTKHTAKEYEEIYGKIFSE